MKVAVTGGTGFVGPAVVEELLKAGHDVVVLEHRRRVPLAPHGRLTRVKGSIDDAAALRDAFSGVDAVVHLVAIIREDKRHGITFERIHVQGARHVVEAAKAAGVRRFVLMSANGVENASAAGGVDTPYFRTKLEMERLVKDAGFEWTIFRPSYIAGPDKGGFDAQFAQIVDTAPVLPSFNGGRFEIQPIARRDVAQAFARALSTPASVGKTYVLVGPERMTWNDYLRRLSALRRRKKPIVYAPAGVVVLAARALGRLFPADPDAIRMLVVGNVGDGSEAVRDFGLTLQSWEDAVAALQR